jgi:phage terminase small subunit
MPGLPLQNVRWERFCQAYVRGPTAGNATACYVAAGFAEDATQASARAASCRLLNKPIIRARLAELQADLVEVEERAVAAAADRLSLSKQLVLGQIARLGFANVLDYVRRDDDGNTVIDLGAVKRDEAAGIVELSVMERGEGPDRVSRMRIRLCDRHAPLVSLGKHFGLFTDRKDDPQEHLRHLSSDELRRHNAELQAKIDDLGRSQPAAPSREAQPVSAGEMVSAATANEAEGVNQS